MKKAGCKALIESIWPGLWLCLPIYPWYDDKGKWTFECNIFREMQTYEVSWVDTLDMLKKFHDLRNQLMEINLGNEEVYLVRENKRFKFSISPDYRYVNGKHELTGKGSFHLWDSHSRSIGSMGIDDIFSPPTDTFVEWIESQTKNYCEGIIPCSRCGKLIKYTEIAGQYFAGVYCQECWDGGMREREARETYN